MSNDAVSEILITTLGIMVFILVVLFAIFIILKMQEKMKKEDKKDIISNKKDEIVKQQNTIDNFYNKQSIINFMEFDKIEDNMIIQKKGKRYLMVIECQGVNYDLMSNMEKIGVEEGFQQFLNTLRHPVQIYIQTRTINLEASIIDYKERAKKIEEQYNQMQYQYTRNERSRNLY